MVDSGVQEEREKPQPYEGAPPKWLPEVSIAGDLGYPGFFPPRPVPGEYESLEANIKSGWFVKPIPAETYTSKAKMIKDLQQEGIMNDLEDFLNQVFNRRADSVAQVPCTSFRIPSRATLNDAKRNSWFKDLANADVPLHKLGKSIPHGVKGNDLLDLLYTNSVPPPRAVWFVGVVGYNETAALRNKPVYNPSQYSADWTNVITGYLKKQLLEIGLPSAPRAGLNIKQLFKGVFNDPDSRERWVSKFSYTIDLLRAFHADFMIDHTLLLTWISQVLSTCNLAQAGFLVRLLEDYLPEMGSCRALLRLAINSCLDKMREICCSPARDALDTVLERLTGLIQRLFVAAPAAFISPSTWNSHSEIIKDSILSSDSSSGQAGQLHDSTAHFILHETFRDVERRNSALLFRTRTQSAKGRLRSMVSDVKFFNSITDVGSVQFLSSQTNFDDELLAHKVFLLLSWSVCWLQYGDHRPYATASLLRQWRDRMEERASRRDTDSPNEFIQNLLFNWLDTNETARDSKNLNMIALLFGELIESGLFSFDQYIQRIIARGEPGLKFGEEPGSCHRMFLRVIPLYRFDAALVNQRKLALHGVRARTIPEDEVEADLKQELRSRLPEVFGILAQTTMPKQTISRASVLRTAARYEKIRIVKWFMPKVRKYLASLPQSKDSSTAMLRVYCVTFECLEVMRCYRTALELNLSVLKSTGSTDLLLATLDDIRRHLDLWACMDAIPTIVETLFNVHNAWKSKGVHIRFLVDLLMHIDDGRVLDSMSRRQIVDGATHFAQALCPATSSLDQVPSILPEVLDFSRHITSNAPAETANALWYKYRSSLDWAYVVWDNVVSSLQQISFSGFEGEDRVAVGHQYAQFLLHVDLHSAEGIDVHVMRWFSGPGATITKSLDSESWTIFSVMLLYLTVHGALEMATLLQGLIMPSWSFGMSVSSSAEYEENRVFFEAVMHLSQLLLTENDLSDSDACPALDLMERQRLRTRRKGVYQDVSFGQLASRIPELVSVELNDSLDAAYRAAAKGLRHSICCDKVFRLAACRNIGAVVDAFSRSASSSDLHETLHKPLVAALRLIFNEKDGQTDQNVLLSPWRLSATAAVTTFILQQTGRNLERDSCDLKVQTELQDLAHDLVNSSMRAEEADFVSEMVKDVNVKVASVFVNEGLSRIADVLRSAEDDSVTALTELPAKAGHYLNLISMIIYPFRRDPSFLQPLHREAQGSCLKSLLSVLKQLVGHIKSLQPASDVAERDRLQQLTESVMFLTRLLHFILSFPNAWTPALKSFGDDFISTILQLTLIYGAGSRMNVVAFQLLLDTIFYLLDDFSIEQKQNPDPYAHYPSPEQLALSSEAPIEHMNALKSLEQLRPAYPFTTDLVYASRNAGELTHMSPVQMRPWEWLEGLGDNQPVDIKDREGAVSVTRGAIRNNTSLPLELFEAKVLGESSRHSEADDASGFVQSQGDNLKALFENDIASESIFERSWRESRTRSDLVDDLTIDTSVQRAVASGKDSGHAQSATSSRASPALSVGTSAGSRSTMVGTLSGATTTRRTQSPALDGTDGDTSRRGRGKRKASSTLTDESAATTVSSRAGRGRGTSRRAVAGDSRDSIIPIKATKKRK